MLLDGRAQAAVARGCFQGRRAPALPAACKAPTYHYMKAVPEIATTTREQRLARAQRAFREHFADCFWSSDPAMEITEEYIPFVIAGLRKNGGHKEWCEAQALQACQ